MMPMVLQLKPVVVGDDDGRLGDLPRAGDRRRVPVGVAGLAEGARLGLLRGGDGDRRVHVPLRGVGGPGLGGGGGERGDGDRGGECAGDPHCSVCS